VVGVGIVVNGGSGCMLHTESGGHPGREEVGIAFSGLAVGSGSGVGIAVSGDITKP
jgi:hypothetical protein